jgi:hypothetical protein
MKLLPASWQVEQGVELTTLCTIEGGAIPLALANTKDVKLAGAWQLSQLAAPNGTCVAGGATVGGDPTKFRPLAWQVAQATPGTDAWFIGGLALATWNVVKSLAECDRSGAP